MAIEDVVLLPIIRPRPLGFFAFALGLGLVGLAVIGWAPAFSTDASGVAGMFGL